MLKIDRQAIASKASADEGEWQNECVRLLLECLAQPTHEAQVSAWSSTRRTLAEIGESLPRKRKVVIAREHRGKPLGVDLPDRDLRGFDFRYCYFARVDFTGSNLSGANFEKVIFRSCNIVACDISGASFLDADADGTTIFRKNYGRADIRFITPPKVLTRFDLDVVDAVEQQERIQNFKRTNQDPLAAAINHLTDFGRGVRLLAFSSAAIVVIFGCLYWLESLSGVGFFPGSPGIADLATLSAQRFLNENPTVNSQSLAVQVLFTMEGGLGFVALSLLTAVFVKKLVA